MVQNGKFALCAFALDRQLKRVDLPTLGNPTIPAFIYNMFFANIQSLESV
jgi:hypothetical protein